MCQKIPLKIWKREESLRFPVSFEIQLLHVSDAFEMSSMRCLAAYRILSGSGCCFDRLYRFYPSYVIYPPDHLLERILIEKIKGA